MNEGAGGADVPQALFYGENTIKKNVDEKRLHKRKIL